MSHHHTSGSRIPDPDHDAHTDGLLMHNLTVVNTMIGRYILHFLDTDSGRTTPIPTTDEHALADRLTNAADDIRARARRREGIRARDAGAPNRVGPKHLLREHVNDDRVLPPGNEQSDA